MGAFHIVCTFMAVIGKRFQDAGLRDLFVEFRPVGPSAVAAVLTGKHYNWAIRSHSLAMESLIRVLWKEFSEWLEDQEDNLTADEVPPASLKKIREGMSKANLSQLCALPSFLSCFNSSSVL